MKKKYRSGSSSILVIMIVMTLVVLGVFSVMSSRSEKSLARVNYKATQDYYELYGESNRILSFLVNRIVEEQAYSPKILIEQLQERFPLAGEIQIQKEEDRLEISIELIKQGKKRLPYELKVLFHGFEGEYEILSSRVLPTEITIDETEIFEIVE